MEHGWVLIEALERFYFGAFKDYVKDVAPRETLPVRKHFLSANELVYVSYVNFLFSCLFVNDS